MLYLSLQCEERTKINKKEVHFKKIKKKEAVGTGDFCKLIFAKAVKGTERISFCQRGCKIESHGTSVTGWLDSFSIFGHLQQ